MTTILSKHHQELKATVWQQVDSRVLHPKYSKYLAYVLAVRACTLNYRWWIKSCLYLVTMYITFWAKVIYLYFFKILGLLDLNKPAHFVSAQMAVLFGVYITYNVYITLVDSNCSVTNFFSLFQFWLWSLVLEALSVGFWSYFSSEMQWTVL